MHSSRCRFILFVVGYRIIAFQVLMNIEMKIYWSGDAYVHYSDVIMSVMASQITSLTIVYSNVYSGADQRKHQSSVPLAIVLDSHPLPYKQ